MENIIEEDLIEKGEEFIKYASQEKHGIMSPLAYDKLLTMIIIFIIILSLLVFINKKKMKKIYKRVFIALILLLILVFILMIFFRNELVDNMILY